jgi:hypothetical protein
MSNIVVGYLDELLVFYFPHEDDEGPEIFAEEMYHFMKMSI